MTDSRLDSYVGNFYTVWPRNLDMVEAKTGLTNRRSVLTVGSLLLASVSAVPLGGCLGSPSFVVDEWDVSYRTDTGSEWRPWIQVVVKNTGSATGSVAVTARVTVEEGEADTMHEEVSLDPRQFQTAIEGTPSSDLVFEEGSRPRLVAEVWLDDARDQSKQETVAGDSP